MSRHFTRYILGALLTLGVGGVAHATPVNPDEPGTTSTGSSDISVTVPALVRIDGIADLTLASFNGTPTGAAAGTETEPRGFDQNDNVCVYSNVDNVGSYFVTVTGGSNGKTTGGSAGYFVGNEGTGMEIPYFVWWNDAANTSSGEQLTSGTKSTQQTGTAFNGNHNGDGCPGSGENANVRVTMSQYDLLGLRPATYTGTITILITPN